MDFFQDQAAEDVTPIPTRGDRITERKACWAGYWEAFPDPVADMTGIIRTDGSRGIPGAAIPRIMGPGSPRRRYVRSAEPRFRQDQSSACPAAKSCRVREAASVPTADSRYRLAQDSVPDAVRRCSKAGKCRMRKKIGDYAVTARLGGGRYGVCFLGEDPEGRRVVLKRFRPGMLRKNRANNHHEAVVLSGISHPALPEMLGVINCRQGYFFVLEYKDGLSLKEWLFGKKKVFSRNEILRIGTQLFEILEYLHSRGIVHGDISTANVIDDGEQTCLIDFGLARYVRKGQKEGGFSLDFAGMAELLLYLLYSSYRGDGRRPWHEELPLTEEQKYFLKRLFGTEEEFLSASEAGREFAGCFGGE